MQLPVFSMGERAVLLNHCINKESGTRESGFRILVGVSGFEPEASWTRTKRDTKLRHTPSTRTL